MMNIHPVEWYLESCSTRLAKYSTVGRSRDARWNWNSYKCAGPINRVETDDTLRYRGRKPLICAEHEPRLTEWMSAFPPLNEKQRDIFERNAFAVAEGERVQKKKREEKKYIAKGREGWREGAKTGGIIRKRRAADVCVTACLAKSISEWYAWILYRLVSAARSSDSLNLKREILYISIRGNGIQFFFLFFFAPRRLEIARRPNAGREFSSFRFCFEPSNFDKEKNFEPSHWNLSIAERNDRENLCKRIFKTEVTFVISLPISRLALECTHTLIE